MQVTSIVLKLKLAQTRKKIYVIIFLVFGRLLIYCAYTQFLNNISTFLSFVTFLSRTGDLHPPIKIPVLNEYTTLSLQLFYSHLIRKAISLGAVINVTKWLERTGPLAGFSLFSVMFWIRVLYFGLKFCSYPFLFPNKKTVRRDRVKFYLTRVSGWS